MNSSIEEMQKAHRRLYKAREAANFIVHNLQDCIAPYARTKARDCIVEMLMTSQFEIITAEERAKIEAERKEREYRDWLKHDPIVYIEHDKATAVVAQFGEFPIEQKIVDLISAAEFLPD